MVEADEDLEVVAEAGTADEAVLHARSYEPDVVVMDVRLPDRSGVVACREIRDEHPDIAVLMLTSFSDDQTLLDSIMAGAAGYVPVPQRHRPAHRRTAALPHRGRRSRPCRLGRAESGRAR